MRIRTMVAVIAGVVCIGSASVASAQHHWNGQGWIHRGDDMPSIVHPDGDPLCGVEFPVGCLGNPDGHGGGHGGMAGPESLVCLVEPIDFDHHEGPIVAGLHCTIEEPGGASTLDGHCTRSGLFRQEVVVRVHYDHGRMAELGLSDDELCLAYWTGSIWERCVDVTFDSSAQTFSVRTTQPAALYAVIPIASSGVEAQAGSWGELKSVFVR